MPALGLSATKINWSDNTEKAFLEALSDDTKKIQTFLSLFKTDPLINKDKNSLANFVHSILNYISTTQSSCSKFLYHFFEEIGHEEIKKLLFFGNKNTQPLLYLYLMSDKNFFANTLIRTLGLNTASIKKLSVQKFSDESIRHQLSLKLLAILASDQPYDTLVSLLCKFGAKLTTKKTSTKNIEFNESNILPRAPIHSAIARGDLEMFNLLVELDSTKKSLEDKTVGNNHTPLHYTAMYGQLAMSKLLLDNKVKIFEKNAHGQNALHLAIINNHPTILETLLQKIKAKYLIPGLVKAFAATDENGYTILHYMAINPNSEFINLAKTYIMQLYFDEKTFDETINKTASITLNNKTITLSAYHFSYIFGNSNLQKLLYGYLHANKNTKKLLELFPENLVNKDNFSTISKHTNVRSDVFRPSVKTDWTTTLSLDNTLFDTAVAASQLNPQQQAIRQWINLYRDKITETVYIPEKIEEKSNNNNAIPQDNNAQPAVIVVEQPPSSLNNQGPNNNNAMPDPTNFNPDATYYAGNQQPQLPKDSEKSQAPSAIDAAKQPAPTSSNNQESNNNNESKQQSSSEQQPSSSQLAQQNTTEGKKPVKIPSTEDFEHFSKWHQDVKRKLEQTSAANGTSNITIKAPLIPMPVYSDNPPSLPVEQILKTYDKEPDTIQTVISNTLKRENSQINSTIINKEVSNAELQLVAEEKNKALQQEEASNNNNLGQVSTAQTNTSPIPDDTEADKPKQTTTAYPSPPPAPDLPTDGLSATQAFSPIDITRSLKKADVNNSKKLPDRDEHLRKIRQGIVLKPISLSERPVGKTPLQPILKQGLSLQEMFEKSMDSRRGALKYDVSSDEDENDDWEEDNQESNKPNRYSMSFTQSIVEMLKDTKQTLDDDNVTISFASQNIKEQMKAKLEKIYDDNTELRNSLPQIKEIESNDNNEQSNNKSFSVILPSAWYNQLMDNENAFEDFKASISQAELN